MENILLVEDNIVNASLICDILKDYSITLFTDPCKSVEYLKNNTPDIILLDLLMPKTSGFDILKEIKQFEHLKDIKVIIISSMNNNESRIKAKSLGANLFIGKPINFNHLRKSIEYELKILS